jgi:hypothetical protein
MFWILGGAGLGPVEAAAISSFVLLGTTPGGYHLAKDGSGAFVNTADTGGGGGAPAGSNNWIQYNSAGAFSASANLQWDNTNKVMYIVGSNSASSGTYTNFSLDTTVNQSGTAGYKAMVVNVTETATGSGVRYLADFQVGGATRMFVTNKGTLGFSNGIEIGYDPGGASASQNALRNVGGISFAASTGGYGADNFHSDGTNMYYDCGNGSMFFRPQGGSTYALYLNNGASGLEYKGSAGTNVFSVSATGTTYVAAGIELGNASDTTITRLNPGVIGVEGVGVLTTTNIATVSNKRITKRVTSVNAPGATPTTNFDTCDIAEFTGLNAAITSMSTNLSGTPLNGDMREFVFLDDGTGRAITWGTSFASSGTVTLPTTTVASTALRVLVQYQTAGSVNKYVCIAVA